MDDNNFLIPHFQCRGKIKLKETVLNMIPNIPKLKQGKPNTKVVFET